MNLQRPFDVCLYDKSANLSSTSEEVKYKQVFNRQPFVTCKLLTSSIKPKFFDNECQDIKKTVENGQQESRAVYRLQTCPFKTNAAKFTFKNYHYLPTGV